MIIGSKTYRNHAPPTGELKFSTGKRIFLNAKEWQEFKNRMKAENSMAVEIEKRKGGWE